MRALLSMGRRGLRSSKLLPGSTLASGRALAFSQAATSSGAGEFPAVAVAACVAIDAGIAATAASAAQPIRTCRRFNMAIPLLFEWRKEKGKALTRPQRAVRHAPHSVTLIDARRYNPGRERRV